MFKKNKILLVAGARPNFMKIAPIYRELKKHRRFHVLIVHTGQHYDKDMSDVFFRDLGLPKPDIYLGVGSASHAVQTAMIMEKFEPVCLKEKPDLVMVVGDVNSTIACALTAVKLGIKIAHVEAGLRSFDRTMPEEINRLLTDQISDYLFTTCLDGNKNLIREGIPGSKIFFVGNTMIDSLTRMMPVIRKKITVIKDRKIKEAAQRPYALVTLHRPSNVDDKFAFQNIVRALSVTARNIPVLFPAHPRTVKRIRQFRMMNLFDCPVFHNPLNDETGRKHRRNDKHIDYGDEGKGAILLMPPLGYMEFMGLMANAALVLTDSGGIQEETTILGIPCLTIRNNTERPITITEGTNKLVGTDPERIIKEAMKIINGIKAMRGYGVQNKHHRNRWAGAKRRRKPKFWDGHAAERIVKVLKEMPVLAKQRRKHECSKKHRNRRDRADGIDRLQKDARGRGPLYIRRT